MFGVSHLIAVKMTENRVTINENVTYSFLYSPGLHPLTVSYTLFLTYTFSTQHVDVIYKGGK